MRYSQLARTAVQAVFGNGLRSALTMLGLVIGISSVIILVGIGDGTNRQVSEKMKALGGDALSAYLFDGDMGYNDLSGMNDLGAVDGVAPSKSLMKKLSVGTTVANKAFVEATDEHYLHVRNLKLQEGRNLSAVDRENRSKVIVLGSDVAKTLLGSADGAVGRTVKLDGDEFTVVGVLQNQGQSMGLNTGNVALVPFSTAVSMGESGTITSFYAKARGEDAIEFDASWYQGDDIKALAHDLVEQYGDSLLEKTPEERFAIIEGYGLPTNIARMERDLKRYKINYDVWFRESTLHESGYVKETIDMLTAKGATYETEDGALWLRSTDFGCDKDDVLRRANGFYTYFAADIAYHRNKFEKRGFDRVINIWGADHHGHVKRLQCALDALGLDGSHRLEIVLMQLVRMMQGGEVVRMSKRTGKSLTLTDLLDEIPVDAARFFFNSRAAETQMEFDLDLAIKQDSDNPLYYVQYAHARICSVLKNAQESGIALPDTGKTDLSVLTGADERQLIKQVALLPEEIVQSAVSRDPSRLNKYAVALAQQFHHFYNACRIKGEPAVRDARLTLCLAAKQTIENVLKLIGVDAPESM